MANLFNTYLYQPLLKVLVFIYQNFAFNDLGLAIIILTIIIRIILFPLFYKGAKDQSLMQRLQPQIKKIQLEYKDNKEKQVQELITFYKKHNLNPFSSFLLLLIQLPILIALYKVFITGISDQAFDNFNFLGLINLRERHPGLVIGAALLQYIQNKMSLVLIPPSSSDKTTAFNFSGKTMVWLGPVLTIIILGSLPSAISLYWAVSTLFSIGQQWFINKKLLFLENGRKFDSKNKNISE